MGIRSLIFVLRIDGILPGDGIDAAFAAAFFFDPASIDCAIGPGSIPPRSNWHSNGKILFV